MTNPGERSAWRMIRQTEDREIPSPPHGELQPLIDHLEETNDRFANYVSRLAQGDEFEEDDDE